MNKWMVLPREREQEDMKGRGSWRVRREKTKQNMAGPLVNDHMGAGESTLLG